MAPRAHLPRHRGGVVTAAAALGVPARSVGSVGSNAPSGQTETTFLTSNDDTTTNLRKETP